MTSYGLTELGSDLASLSRRTGSAWKVWANKAIEPVLREEVMVAVAEAVGCRFCTFSHRELLLAEGESVEGLASFENRNPEESGTFTAIMWAQSMVENDFRLTSPEIQRAFEREFSANEREHLETVAIAMKLMSSCGHEADAFVSRLKGNPVPGSGPANEAVMSALYFPPAALVYLALAARRRNLGSLLRDFTAFSKRFNANRDVTATSPGAEGAMLQGALR